MTAKPVTASQHTLLTKLFIQVWGQDNADEARLEWTESFPHGPTAADASAKIDALIAFAKTITTPTPDGIHHINNTVYRVRHSKAGHQYAERLLTQIEREEAGEGTVWVYEGRKPLAQLDASTVLAPTKARAYGKAYGLCARCGVVLKQIDDMETGTHSGCKKA